MIRALILIAALCLPVPALAHKVIASVFPSGSNIEGEIGMSDGTMAVGQKVEVFDDAGKKLGETVTDNDGFFLFTPLQPVAHVFRADLGAGHVAEVTMPAAEVASLMGQEAANGAAGASVLGGNTPVMTAAADVHDATSAEIATMLRNELRPIRQELTALKNASSFQSVLGGIGYIFGLFGLGFYLAARRRLEAKK